MHTTQLVRCTSHGEAFCWVQLDGSHKSRLECSCGHSDGWACPIDAHSIAWNRANPMFDDEPIEAAEKKADPPAEEGPAFLLRNAMLAILSRRRQR